MSSLRIGALHLAAKDNAYIRALVRLFSYSDKLDWTFAEQAPFDVVVTSAAGRGAHALELARCGATVLTLVTTRAPHAPDELEYPIRADQFRAWLQRRAAQVVAAADTAKPAAPPAALAAGAAAPLPLASAAPAGPGAAATGTAPAARFKLRRWPSVQQLRGDALRIRMATLMAKHPLSVEELAQLIELPLAVCRDFIDALQDANLLVASGPAPAHAGPHAGPHTGPAPAAGAVPTPQKAGLLASIRRRFGL